MQERGLEVHAISSPADLLQRFGSEEGVAVHSVEMPRQITPFQDLRATWQLVRTLRSIRPDIVHAHTPKGGLLGMMAATIARAPARIYHIRGLPYMTATGRRRLTLMTTERISCRLAHRVFCVSNSMRDVAISDRICPEDKVIVFGGGSGNGVDATDRFNPARVDPGQRDRKRERLGVPAEALVIGFVGRIVRDKGIHELADAWRVIRDLHPQSHLVLAGPWEPQDPIDPDVVRFLGADKRVHLLGMIDDISEIYPVFDVVVLPTYREGFPNVPLEAAAMRLPVVATRVPGCVDAVQDGITGTLVPPRDAAALEAAILRYLEDPELRQSHGEAGRERVLREFRQDVIWQGVYEEYRRLLEWQDRATRQT